MIRDSVFSRDGLILQKFVTVAGAVETPVPNAVLRWAGMQGIFPQPYRGWGIAGYTAGEGLRDVAMAESAFVIDPASFPTDEPTRDDVSLDEAHTEPSYAFIPAVAPGGGTTAEPVAPTVGSAREPSCTPTPPPSARPGWPSTASTSRTSRRRRRAAGARRRPGSASAARASPSASASARSAPRRACRRASA